MSNELKCPHLCVFWIIKRSKEYQPTSRRWLERCKHGWMIEVSVDIVNHITVKHWHDPLGNLSAVTGKQNGSEEERVKATAQNGEMEGLTRQSNIQSEISPTLGSPAARIVESQVTDSE